MNLWVYISFEILYFYEITFFSMQKQKEIDKNMGQHKFWYISILVKKPRHPVFWHILTGASNKAFLDLNTIRLGNGRRQCNITQHFCLLTAFFIHFDEIAKTALVLNCAIDCE